MYYTNDGINLYIGDMAQGDREATVEEVTQYESIKSAIESQLASYVAKELALNSITVTTTSGKVFDGRPKDITFMSGAINASNILVEAENARFATIVNPTTDQITEHETNLTKAKTTIWRMHDNNNILITLDEAKEALAKSMQAIGAIKTT